MTPREARIGLTTFALLMAGLGVNLLALQTQAPGTKVRGERATATPADKMRRMGIAPNADPMATAPPVTIGAAKVVAPVVPPEPEGVETIRAIQRELQQRGYETGSADGVPGLTTRAAIMAWEHDNGLALSGEANEDVLKRILLGASAGEPAPATAATRLERRASAEAVIRTVQQTLSGLGYNTGKVDGRLGEDTLRAIRDFEIDNQLPETGRVSGTLIARLAKAAGSGRLPGARP